MIWVAFWIAQNGFRMKKLWQLGFWAFATKSGDTGPSSKGHVCVVGRKHNWWNETRARKLEMGRLSNLAKRCQDGKVMAFLAQTTLKRDSSFATGKDKKGSRRRLRDSARFGLREEWCSTPFAKDWLGSNLVQMLARGFRLKFVFEKILIKTLIKF